LVRVDKTLSELWSLKDSPEDFTIEQLKEVATMAINALHKQELEHEKFVNASYETIRKEEEKVKRLEKEIERKEKNTIATILAYVEKNYDAPEIEEYLWKRLDKGTEFE
jgi:predicted transcriptional regulator